MLKLNENTQYHLNGTVDFLNVIKVNEKEQVKVFIDSIFKLSDTEIYFNWSISKLGFGELSLYLVENVWYINNECLPLEVCCQLLDSVESAIIQEDNEKALDFLKKFKKNLVVYANSDTYEVIDLDTVSISQLVTQGWQNIVKD